MSKKMNESELDEEMLEAFKKFSGGKEFISQQDLTRVIKDYGENLNSDELEQLYNETCGEDGAIRFKDFILMMMAK